MDQFVDDDFATASPQQTIPHLPPPPRGSIPPTPPDESPHQLPQSSPNVPLSQSQPRVSIPQPENDATEQEQVPFPSSSPFTNQFTGLLVSVSKPSFRNGNANITFEVNTHDIDEPGPDLQLLGVSSIYPIAHAVRTTVYRRFQSFQVLYQILALYFPFAIIPPLPETPICSTSPSQLQNGPSNSTSPSQSQSIPALSSMEQHLQTAGLLHLFLTRLANHPVLSDSTIMNYFLTHDDDQQLFDLFTDQLVNKVQISTHRHFITMLAQGKQQCKVGLSNLAATSLSLPPLSLSPSEPAPTLFPLAIYTSIEQQLEKNIVPVNYPAARASVWNLCSTTLEASQGLRTSQGNNNVIQIGSGNNSSGTASNAANNNFDTSVSPPPATSSSALAPPSTLNSDLNQARAVTKIFKASDAVALAAEVAVAPATIMLGDVRSEEDGLRVENYLAALNDKLSALTLVLYEYDRQQSTLATSLSSLGEAVVTWSRYELFHHEDIRSILDAFAVALSRPHVETTPGPIRTQIIDYMTDLNRQTQSVRSCLLWRISLGTRLKSIGKTYQDNQNKIQSLQSSTNSKDTQMSTEHEIERLQQLNRALYQDRQLQQRYLDLMHSYMIIEIAYWRRIRRQEIKKCIHSYALAMKQVCLERINMWASVEHDIGQQLNNITQVRPFERR